MQYCRYMKLAAVALVGVTACMGFDGDPAVFVVNGEPTFGYAWSMPTGYSTNVAGIDYEGWQITFTKGASCHVGGGDEGAGLTIVSPLTTTSPNTNLPPLSTTTIPITTFGTDITFEMASLDVRGSIAPSGSLRLTTYGADEVAGSFSARDTLLDSSTYEGTFRAPRCRE